MSASLNIAFANTASSTACEPKKRVARNFATQHSQQYGLAPSILLDVRDFPPEFHQTADNPHSPHSPHSQQLPDVLALLLSKLSYGVLVLGKQRRVLYANEAALRELERCGVLMVRDSTLQTLSLIDSKTLCTALLHAAAGKSSLLRLAASGMALTLSVVPLGGNPASECDHIGLFFARGELSESGMFSFFSRGHGFTPTEEQVLVLLCRSLSTPEIALQLKVAVSTVRSHVRSLCVKTGSSGARELVNLVARLPPAGLPPCSKGRASYS